MGVRVTLCALAGVVVGLCALTSAAFCPAIAQTSMAQTSMACVRPESPVAPPTHRAPTLAELNAMADALMRHQMLNNAYLACLDRQLVSPRLNQSQRTALVSAYNAAAPETARLWGAYDDATNRYRDAAKASAKAAANRAPRAATGEHFSDGGALAGAAPASRNPN